MNSLDDFISLPSKARFHFIIIVCTIKFTKFFRENKKSQCICHWMQPYNLIVISVCLFICFLFIWLIKSRLEWYFVKHCIYVMQLFYVSASIFKIESHSRSLVSVLRIWWEYLILCVSKNLKVFQSSFSLGHKNPSEKYCIQLNSSFIVSTYFSNACFKFWMFRQPSSSQLWAWIHWKIVSCVMKMKMIAVALSSN